MNLRDETSETGSGAPAWEPGPALKALRRATASSHAAIEQVLQLGPEAPAWRFDVALQVFEGFLRVCEPRVSRALPARMRAWFDAHRRAHLAAQDVRFLKLRPLDLGHIAAISLPTPAVALGSAYVIEGSARGGLVIAKALATRFGIDAAHGGSFFGARRASAANGWRDFCDLLEHSLDADLHAHEQACEGALLTFERLSLAFSAELGAIRPAAA